MNRLKAFGVFILSVSLLTIVYVLAVKTPLGQALENRVLSESEFNNDPSFPLAFVQPYLIIFALTIMSAYVWYKMSLRKAILLWIVAGLSMAVAQVLKITLKRNDLINIESAEELIENTLPSGHMSVFVTLATTFLLIISENRWRLGYWFSNLVLIVVAWQLLDYGWHRPSDLIAAISVTALVYALIKFFVPNLVGYQQSLKTSVADPNQDFRKVLNIILAIAAWLIFIAFAAFASFIVVQAYVETKTHLIIGFVAVFIFQLVFTRLIKVLR